MNPWKIYPSAYNISLFVFNEDYVKEDEDELDGELCSRIVQRQ